MALRMPMPNKPPKVETPKKAYNRRRDKKQVEATITKESK